MEDDVTYEDGVTVDELAREDAAELVDGVGEEDGVT